MSEVLDMKLPEFIRAHTPWYPKARVRNGMIEIRCAGKAFSVPHTGKPKDDQKAATDAVREYARQHGWAEVI